MLTDFGIARFAAHITQAGGLRGTPAYLSPEQIEGTPTDCRSDIFSLGIVLYQLATGQRPFQSDSVEAVCAQILKAKITPPTKVNPMLPRAFDGIIERCMARKPENRYANGEILSTELEAVARQPVPAARPKPVRNPSISTAFRYAGAAAALVLALSVPIAARFYRHNLQLPPAPVATYAAPKPPADLPLWRDTQAAAALTSDATAEELPVRPLVQPKPARTTKQKLEAAKPNPTVADAGADGSPSASAAAKSAEQPAASAATA